MTICDWIDKDVPFLFPSISFTPPHPFTLFCLGLSAKFNFVRRLKRACSRRAHHLGGPIVPKSTKGLLCTAGGKALERWPWDLTASVLLNFNTDLPTIIFFEILPHLSEIWQPWHAFFGNPELKFLDFRVLGHKYAESDVTFLIRVPIEFKYCWICLNMATLKI